MKSIKDHAGSLFSFDIGKYILINLIMTLFLNVYLEMLQRKSPAALLLFIHQRTFMFLFNGLLIFTTLSAVFLLRKKIFAYAMAGGSWLLVGLINGVILSHRKTPFTAVDLTVARSALPVIRAYLSLPQIIACVILMVLMIAGMVCLFLYTREQKRAYDARVGFFWMGLIGLFFLIVLKTGTNKGILARKFDNLMDAYRDYGVAYSFFITAVDTGIDRPMQYSRGAVDRILRHCDQGIQSLKDGEGDQEKRRPNVIFVQLESFFDPGVMKNLKISQDPVPNLHRLQKDYIHGNLNVSVYGAGTINTEFEVITGMNLEDFGSGEYPYRSIIHKRTCDNISYWLEEEGYYRTVIHNNNAAFYDRDKVYANLGFQSFISMENMDISEFNEIGWPKDYVLEDQIMDALETSPEKDLIYTISVQGHGDYPQTPRPEDQEDRIKVTGENMSDNYCNAWTYYANEIYEMDDFIGRLTDRLSSYPEDVILVFYGDHLPGMNIDNKDLEGVNRFQTPYVIWDNYGRSRKEAEKESGDLETWQLASRILGSVKIYKGTLNRYHQTMSDSKKYKKNLRLLEYDMLYGSNFVRRLNGKKDLKPSEIRYGIHDPVITGLSWDEETGDYILEGDYFTDYSRVYGDHIRIRSEKIDRQHIRIPVNSMKKAKELTVIQVSAENEKIHYNESAPWQPDWEVLEESKPAVE